MIKHFYSKLFFACSLMLAAPFNLSAKPKIMAKATFSSKFSSKMGDYTAKVVFWGGLALGGYLLWKYAKSTDKHVIEALEAQRKELLERIESLENDLDAKIDGNHTEVLLQFNRVNANIDSTREELLAAIEKRKSNNLAALRLQLAQLDNQISAQQQTNRNHTDGRLQARRQRQAEQAKTTTSNSSIKYSAPKPFFKSVGAWVKGLFI